DVVDLSGSTSEQQAMHIERTTGNAIAVGQHQAVARIKRRRSPTEIIAVTVKAPPQIFAQHAHHVIGRAQEAELCLGRLPAGLVVAGAEQIAAEEKAIADVINPPPPPNLGFFYSSLRIFPTQPF